MPFFHASQMDPEVPLRDPGDGTDAQNAIIAANDPIAELVYTGGSWHIRNRAATGSQWSVLSNQKFYIPEGRVRAIRVGAAASSDSPDTFYAVNFDMPFPRPVLYQFGDATTHPSSHGSWDWFPTGVLSQCWITRIRFTADTTATKIVLYG